MNNKEVKSGAVQGTATNKKETTKTTIRPNLTGKEAKDEAGKDKAPAQTPQVEEAKTPEAKTDSTATVDNQPANVAEAPKAEEVKQREEAKPQAEPTKKELKEQFIAQQERKLAETVKIVEVLGKKIAQKTKLENTIGNIDSFTIAQSDDKDDMASDSRFARCELVISDDDGNEFVTKNPFIIAYVAQEVKQLCIDKLAEVEASIVIPA
jgi:type IV secretory pathway VirB10-like protein